MRSDHHWIRPHSWGLAPGTYTADTAHHWGAGASHRKSTTRTRSRASLGSGVSIRSRGIHRHPREAPHDSEHESAGEPLRQCQLRKFHEDTEAGRNLCPRQIRRPGTSPYEHRRVHRGVLQSAAVALGAGLSIPGTIPAMLLTLLAILASCRPKPSKIESTNAKKSGKRKISSNRW